MLASSIKTQMDVIFCQRDSMRTVSPILLPYVKSFQHIFDRNFHISFPCHTFLHFGICCSSSEMLATLLVPSLILSPLTSATWAQTWLVTWSERWIFLGLCLLLTVRLQKCLKSVPVIRLYNLYFHDCKI